MEADASPTAATDASDTIRESFTVSPTKLAELAERVKAGKPLEVSSQDGIV